MRETLFRGKRLDNGEWVQACTIIRADDEIYIPIPTYAMSQTHPADKDQLCVVNILGINAYKVDLETVGQFTGLTDKNGTMIFEGDIVRGHGNPKDLAQICFSKFKVYDMETDEPVDEVIGWHSEVIPTDALSKCEPFSFPVPLTDYYIKRCEWEVIGNIHDNPELIRGNNNE